MRIALTAAEVADIVCRHLISKGHQLDTRYTVMPVQDKDDILFTVKTKDEG